MRRVVVPVALLLGLLLFGIGSWLAHSLGREPVGIDHRIPWTSSRVKGSPDPPAPYRTELAFPKLVFESPLDMVHIPGSDRLAVVEWTGKIRTFSNDPTVDKSDLLLELPPNLYGLVFHPRFAENGYIYVSHTHEPTREVRVSRFQVSRDGPLRASAESERVLLSWPASAHHGGSLKFGPDGFLYVGVGDGSDGEDERNTGQDISDLLASILRIDVDAPEDKKPYRIPPDNPFASQPGARPEIWAYGIRHPWKMSFDRATGEHWVGEVGQDLWESVLRVERGGNYGWSVVEAGHPYRPDRKPGPTTILPSVIQHPHSEFRALIGGYVYRGSRFPDLVGTYVYGDHETGRIWGLRHDGGKATWNGELARTHHRIVSFGEDAAGELFVLDFFAGTIHRLVPNPTPPSSSPFPRKLSETGLFASVPDHQPAPGVIPYSVNAPLWSDHAHKERFIALPGVSQIGFHTAETQPSLRIVPGWSFPDGTVLVKTFSLEMERGNPASRRRLETRILHLEKLANTDEIRDQYWRGYTYIWNDEQTDAILADAAGVDRTYPITDPASPGGTRRQTWHFPSRAECTLCHSMPANFVLGVGTLQMNRDHDYGGVVANQLRTLDHLGVFRKPLPLPPSKLPKLADYQDEWQDIHLRARAYLHANCAHCHVRYGGGNSPFQLQANLNLSQTGMLDARPVHGSFGMEDARVVAPGSPERSVLLHRMTLLGHGRMPPVASAVVDERGTKLIRDWIRQGPSEPMGPLGHAMRNCLFILAIWSSYRAGRWLWNRSRRQAGVVGTGK